MSSHPDIEVESLKGKRSLILGLTWPALAESILASLVSMIDMIMVGALGAFAIGAVGLVTQPRFVMLAAFMAMNVGSTAMVARFKGARDKESADMALNQALIMATGISVILCISLFFGGNGLIRFLAGSNISEEMILGANEYLRIQVYGFPALALTFTINAALRGSGNTRAAFYNNAVGNVVKVIMNYCLISGNFGFPALGLAGASIATCIAQCVTLAMALSKVLSGKEYIRLDIRKMLNVNFSMIRRIWRIGFPALVEQVFMRVGMMLFTIIVTSLGDHSYAAHMIAMNLQQLSFMTGMSFGAAATTLVGQSLGRVRVDLAKTYVKMTHNLCLIISILVSLLLFFGGELIASLYTTDRALSLLASNMIKIIALVNVFSNARFIYNSALRGAGDSRFVALITFVGILILRPLVSIVLVYSLFPFQLGLAGIWIALSADGVVCFFLARARFARGKWAEIKV